MKNINKLIIQKRALLLTIILMLVSILSGCRSVEKDKVIVHEENVNEVVVNEDTLPLGTPSMGEKLKSASEIVKLMGTGWNLGSTLESVNNKKYKTETLRKKKLNYQVMAIYSTKRWTGWDASSAPYISADGTLDFTWKINTLNSNMKETSGQLSLQFINNEIGDIGEDRFEFKINQAYYTKSNGDIINLDQFVQQYSITLKDGISDYVSVDISKIEGMTSAADLLQGTLTIAIEVTNYPEPVSSDAISTEEYYETLWGNPVTTKALIESVHEAGFKAVRIPITYYDHMDEEGNISEQWLDRVEEVVGYVLDNDMYCIINTHHDRAWLTADAEKFGKTSKMFQKVWGQIAERFKDYDNELLFEGFNEILNSKQQWTNVDASSYETVNKLNQVFIETIRGGSSNNKTRVLIVNTYAGTTTTEALSAFKTPIDSIKNRLIVQVHIYDPNDFCLNQEEVWGKEVRSNWKVSEDEATIDQIFARITNNIDISKVPVIIGEFGAWNKNNTDDRCQFVSYFMKKAKELGIACFWWDNGGKFKSVTAVNNGALFNRETGECLFPEVVATLTE